MGRFREQILNKSLLFCLDGFHRQIPLLVYPTLYFSDFQALPLADFKADLGVQMRIMCRTRTSHVAEMKNILDSTVNIILK